MAGLRERKKAATMRRIQQEAVTLFRERGFDAVTVEQVAEAAETSPSTIYRYFHTKEGLVLHDEYDDAILTTFMEAFRDGESMLTAAAAAFGAISEDHFGRDLEETLFRVELWREHRGFQAAAAVYLVEVSEAIAAFLAEGGTYDAVEAQFIASATVHGFVAAILQWHADGASRPAEEYVMRGIHGLSRALNENSSAQLEAPTTQP